MSIKLSFRWFGKEDKIPLRYISQIPDVLHIVSAVYGVRVGEVWDREALRTIAEECRANGMRFSVAESIPVHERIKLGEDCEQLIESYCENVRRVSEVGVDCVTYNFMPIFDWTRTQLNKLHPDGSHSLVMYKHQLQDLDPLHDNISLPGWDASYTQEEVRALIGKYRVLGEEGLWENLERFLKKILPVAEECGVKMAIHPDDPPYPIFGIPRIIRDEESLMRVISLQKSPSNCLCICTGSLGCTDTNDVYSTVERFAREKRIAFVHMRNVKNLSDGSFEEVAHPTSCGSVDMYRIAKILTEHGYDGYIRPDHGRMIWGEEGKPGYGLYDRALGASYISGLFEACERENGARAGSCFS